MPTRTLVPADCKPGDLTGARLVGQVPGNWSHLPDLHFRALARMALTALDGPTGRHPAAHYWGGRELIACTWRWPWPDGDSDDDKRKRRTILHEVTVVCRELRQEGAVEIVKGYRPPGPGRRQTFLLTLANEPMFTLGDRAKPAA